jgi:hypothetical protein
VTGVITSAIAGQAFGDLLAGALRKFRTGVNLALHVDENLTAYKEVDEMLKAYKVAKYDDFVLTTGAKSHPRTIVLTPEILKDFDPNTANQYRDEVKLKKAFKEQLKLSISEIQDIFKKRTINVLGIDDYLSKGIINEITPKYYFDVNQDATRFSFKNKSGNRALTHEIFKVTTDAKGNKVLSLIDGRDSVIKAAISDNFATFYY